MFARSLAILSLWLPVLKQLLQCRRRVLVWHRAVGHGHAPPAVRCRCGLRGIGWLLSLTPHLHLAPPRFGNVGNPFAIPPLVVSGVRPPIPPTMPGVLADIIHACWGGMPASRPSFEQLEVRGPPHCLPWAWGGRLSRLTPRQRTRARYRPGCCRRTCWRHSGKAKRRLLAEVPLPTRAPKPRTVATPVTQPLPTPRTARAKVTARGARAPTATAELAPLMVTRQELVPAAPATTPQQAAGRSPSSTTLPVLDPPLRRSSPSLGTRRVRSRPR